MIASRQLRYTETDKYYIDLLRSSEAVIRQRQSIIDFLNKTEVEQFNEWKNDSYESLARTTSFEERVMQTFEPDSKVISMISRTKVGFNEYVTQLHELRRSLNSQLFDLKLLDRSKEILDSNQVQIFKLISDGLNDQEIADRLHINTSEYQARRNNLARKMRIYVEEKKVRDFGR